MSASPVTALLAKLTVDELHTMQAGIRQDLQRLQFEDQLVEAALAKHSRRSPSGRRAGNTRKRVLAAIGAREKPSTPAEIIAVLKAEGPAPSGAAIHNMVGRLVREGELERVGEGQYQLASRDGADPTAPSGPNENEASGPSFPAARPQEGASGS